MAELNVTNAFNDCVDRLAQGQTIEDCLRRYPQYASTLRPMLEAGLLVQRARIQPAEVLAAQTRVRRRFEDALRAPPPKQTSLPRRFVFAMAAIIIFGFVSVGSLTAISQNSLPGDPLYGIKTLSEGLQQSLFDNETLEGNLKQRRIQEIQKLLALGRSEEVTFSGTVTAQNGTNWIIATLPITVQADLPNSVSVHLGDEVNVTARTTEQRSVIAVSIQVIEPASAPLPTPTVNRLVATNVAPTQTPSTTVTTSVTSTSTIMTPTPQSTTTKMPSTATYVPAPPAVPQITLLTPTQCAPIPPDGWIAYQIRPGDTLSALASSTSIGLNELMAANCITDARLIVVGETIYLPKQPSASAPTVLPAPNNQNSDSNNSGSNNSGVPGPTDDHGGDNSGHGGNGSGSNGGGGGSDDGSGHN